MEPDQLPIDFAFAPKVDRRTKEGKAEWAAAKSANAGKTLVDHEAYKAALAIRDNVHANHAARELVCAAGESERTIQWTYTDEREDADGRVIRTRLPCKGRIDRLRADGVRIDLKGIGTDLRVAKSIIMRNWYAEQQGAYDYGLCKSEGIVGPTFLLCYEDAPPFDVMVVSLSELELANGWERFRRVLAGLAAQYPGVEEVRPSTPRTGVWPGRHQGVQDAKLPPWNDPDYDPDSQYDTNDLIIGGEDNAREFAHAV